jgi:uncharacterized protein
VTIHYLDASAWVKRYFQEEGSDRVRRLFQRNEALSSSWLGYVEVSATIARQSTARNIGETQRLSMEAQLDYEWKFFLQGGPSSEGFISAVSLARQYALRGADALHLANAMQMNERFRMAGDDLALWSSDRELVEAALKAGLRVENPLLPGN